MPAPRPVVLCILDGWGLRDETEANAVALARTPVFDRIMATSPHATLVTHGPDVGLPRGQMGNSEVGHTNIGAGRIVAMDLGQIDLAIEDGSFFRKDPLLDFIAALQDSGGTAHLFGVVSDGGVHGHVDHIAAAARTIADAGVPVRIHAVTDGRDVAPRSALDYLARLQADLPAEAAIATVIGRYYAMDRDRRWDRIETAYSAIVLAEGDGAETPEEAVEQAYADDISDEFIRATVIEGYEGVAEGDGFFCLNFRADRARQILSAIGDPDFDEFDIEERPHLAAMLGMVDYSDRHDTYMASVFPKQKIRNTLAQWIAHHRQSQFHIAETEKYPHVTFFLNGGKEAPEDGEERHMVPSPKVATYDLQPEMSAPEVADRLVDAVAADYAFIVVNFANPDMVGHTGDLQAAIMACETVDHALGRLLDALKGKGGAAIVTADHGNCETMVDPETGGPHTSHTTNLVPVVMVGGPAGATLADGRLADLAPTVLELMEIAPPDEMTGQSLIRR